MGASLKKSRRQSDAPGEEGEEIKSPKRNRIRVESQETQDCVKEANDMQQEECQCSEKNLLQRISEGKR